MSRSASRSTLRALAMAAVLGGLSAAPVAQARKPVAPAKTTSAAWSGTATQLPEGAMLIGNPKARVRVIEYLSYTCGHCASLHSETKDVMAAYLNRGTVALEIRQLVRDPMDLSAALLARCGNPAQFVARHNAVMGNHAKWMGTFRALKEPDLKRWEATEAKARRAVIARDLGLIQTVAPAGVTPPMAQKCLTDPAALVPLEKLFHTANAAGVDGTPTVEVNGKRLDGHDWPTIKSALDAALAGK